MATRTTPRFGRTILFAGDTAITKGDPPNQDSPCTTRLRWQNGLLSQTIFNHAQHFNEGMDQHTSRLGGGPRHGESGEQEGMHRLVAILSPNPTAIPPHTARAQQHRAAHRRSMPCYPPINGLVLALSIHFVVRVSSFSGTSVALRIKSRAAAAASGGWKSLSVRSGARGEIMSASSPTFIDIGANLLDDVFQGRYHGGSQKHEPDLNAVLERATAAGVEKVCGWSIA